MYLLIVILMPSYAVQGPMMTIPTEFANLQECEVTAAQLKGKMKDKKIPGELQTVCVQAGSGTRK